MSKSKRAALYIRVSTEEQARHGYSLAEQEHDLRQYAEQHGYSVVGLYTDEGTTARKALSRRKGLQRLLEDVQEDAIDIILFKCLDRWFRNIADYYKVQEILDQHNVLWECTQEDFNTTTTNGRLMLNLKLSLAQHESDQTSDRIKYVFEGHLRDGRVITGRLPVGYLVGDDKRIHIDESTAEMARDMFRYFLIHRTVLSTRRMLQEKYGWRRTSNTIVRALKNKIYIGEYYGIKNFCPALIDEGTFKRAQKIFEGRTRYHRSNNIYLFVGLLRCPSCGRVLSATGYTYKDKVSIYYRCHAHHTLDCPFNRHLPEIRLEAALLDSVENALQKFSVDISRTLREEGPTDAKATVESLRAKQSRLKELYIEGMLSRDVFDQRHNDLDIQITALRPKPETRHLFLGTIDAKKFRERYDALDKTARKEFWSRTLEVVHIAEDGTLTPVFSAL